MEVGGQDAEQAGDGLQQQQHRFNVQLPYKDRIPSENELLLSEIKEALAKFTDDADDRHLFRACSG